MPWSAPVVADERRRRAGRAILAAFAALFAALALAGCGIGESGSREGFTAGADFSYMAEVADASDGTTHFGLIHGTVSSDGQVTGERRIVNVHDGSANDDTTEFTGQANEDGTATFHELGPDGGDVTATLEESESIMTTDVEPGVAATTWHRASLQAFNTAIRGGIQG
ncbi:hypothetical protein [Myceligenerans indicum]|uniref:Uncharacterized protein n=1 Tax=Myceligenerans indicum TaxID=2593663 RepID=A0ABS1LET6_9MICO|nr:hypothetical protein [Myceligenerans indicum]MBL0884786.1 hypothetical protein [Myceligenerans indicum]